MQQLTLPIVPRLEYSADNFIVHSGIDQGYRFCSELLASSDLLHVFFNGERRCGKSHMALSLASRAAHSCLLEGAEFSALMHHYPAAQIAKRGRALIIDDAQLYLGALRPGQSGPLVSLFEECKRLRTSLVFFSLSPLSEFAFDEHIASRLASSVRFSMQAPQVEELEQLMQAMARQRGLFLSQRHVRTLTRRMPRDLAVLEEFLQRINALENGKRRLTLAAALGQGL